MQTCPTFLCSPRRRKRVAIAAILDGCWAAGRRRQRSRHAPRDDLPTDGHHAERDEYLEIPACTGPRLRHNARQWDRLTGARVLRGGSFNNNPDNVRCAYRNRNDPDNRNHNIGFRVVASPFSSTSGL